jgi:hypothetical protein
MWQEIHPESDPTKHLPCCKPMKKNVKSAEKGISRLAGRLSMALENRSRSALSRFGLKKLSEDSVNSGRSGDGPKKRRGVLEDDSMSAVSTSCSDYVLVRVHEHCRVVSGPAALPSLPSLLLIHSQCLNTKNLHHFIHYPVCAEPPEPSRGFSALHIPLRWLRF